MDQVPFARSFLGTYSPADVQMDAGGTFVLVTHGLDRDHLVVVVFPDDAGGTLANKVETIDQLSCKVYCTFSVSVAVRIVA